MAKAIINFEFKGLRYERDISISINRNGATGSVFNAGKKTGYYRWNRGFTYPVFYSTSGRKISGAHPLIMAITQEVKAFCNNLRAKKVPDNFLKDGDVFKGSKHRYRCVKPFDIDSYKAAEPKEKQQMINTALKDGVIVKEVVA